MSSRTPSRGLPTNPRPRSKSAAAPVASRDISSTGMHRPALPAHPRARPPLPLPQSREIGTESAVKSVSSRRIRNDKSPSGLEPRPRVSDDSSVNSTSSSGSSFWSRGKTSSSSASSQTDLQRNDHTGGLDVRHDNEHGTHKIGATSEGDSHLDPKELAGLAWGRMTEVANVFSNEVSKVWANGLTPLATHSDGTEYQEEESHLLRVMRNYHLSKARTPSDLPEWLFTSKERGLSGGKLLSTESRNDGSRSTSQHRDDLDNNVGANSRGLETRLRNVQNLPRTIPSSSPPIKKSAGADRLRMIRDKRAIPSGNRI